MVEMTSSPDNADQLVFKNSTRNVDKCVDGLDNETAKRNIRQTIPRVDRTSRRQETVK